MSDQQCYVCPDTKEFFVAKSMDGILAIDYLITSSKVIGVELEETTTPIIGRWFNKRVARVVSGLLYTQLTAQAEADEAAKRIAITFDTNESDLFGEDYDPLLADILGSVREGASVAESDEADALLEEEEEEREEKDAMIVTEQAEYTNITDMVMDAIRGGIRAVRGKVTT